MSARHGSVCHPQGAANGRRTKGDAPGQAGGASGGGLPSAGGARRVTKQVLRLLEYLAEGRGLRIESCADLPFWRGQPKPDPAVYLVTDPETGTGLGWLSQEEKEMWDAEMRAQEDQIFCAAVQGVPGRRFLEQMQAAAAQADGEGVVK